MLYISSNDDYLRQLFNFLNFISKSSESESNLKYNNKKLIFECNSTIMKFNSKFDFRNAIRAR